MYLFQRSETTMSFKDIMSQPLPSQKEGVMTESVLDDNTEVVTGEDIPVPVVNDDDIDPTLDDDVTPEDIDDVNTLTDDDENVELSPEEELEANRIIDLAATPIILKNELGTDALQEFCNSDDYTTAVDEGLLEESSLDMLLESMGDLFNDEVYTEAKFFSKNKVQFTKEARMNQLFEVCVQAVARAKKDPLYFKLAKVQKLRRNLKAKLRAKYRTAAMKKAKEYLVRLKKSRSGVLSNMANKMFNK